MKKVMFFLTLFFVCLSFKVMAEDYEEIQLITPTLSEEQEVVLITNDFIDIEWVKDKKIEKYEVYYFDKDYNIKEYELTNGETSCRIENIEYGYYYFSVDGYDKNDELIANSRFILYRADKKAKKLIIENPIKESVILDKYKFKRKVIWNMICSADDYRITFYHGDKVLEETNEFTYRSFIKDDFIDNKLKTIKIVVEALKEGNVISSDSVEVQVSTNSRDGFTSEIKGLKDDDVLVNNWLNCEYVTNADVIMEDMTYSIKIINKENNEIISEIYNHSLGNSSQKPVTKIRTALDNGDYILEVRALLLSDFPDNYDVNYAGEVNENVKKNMDAAGKITEYDKKTLSFKVKRDPQSPDCPSILNEELIRDNLWLIPRSLSNKFHSNLTREESCDLLIPWFENNSSYWYVVNDSDFSDTNNINVTKAYRNKIVDGIGDGLFGPLEHVTREEFCVMLVNMMKALKFEVKVDYSKKFTDDDDISSWAKESVYYLYENGVIKEIEEGRFSPKDYITREQSIVMLINLDYFEHALFEQSYYSYYFGEWNIQKM